MRSSKIISTFILLIIGLILCFPQESEAKKKALRFAAGFQGGTYYQIGNSLNKIEDLEFDVQTTGGSKENILLIRDRKADFGMVQLDILINMSKTDAKITSNVKILLPVYAEEVHLVASKDIKSIEDLKGKKVSIGPRDSGIQGTARIILQNLKIKESGISIEQFPVFVGLQQLLIKRKIDAMFVVAGAPVEMLSTIPKEASGVIHMIPFSSSQIATLTGGDLPYSVASISSKDYSWISEPVATVAVDSVLIVRSDIKPKHVKTIIESIFTNQSKFIQVHKKWKELSKENVKKILEKRKNFFHEAAVEAINAL